jgi:threonine/homoserine/homoserine lactone efflux protein
MSDLLAVAVAVAVAVVVPGPNVVAVVSTAMRDRRAAVRTALGVSTGDMVWAVGALAGLGAALANARPVFLTLKWVGAAYLVAYAIRLYRNRDEGPAGAGAGVGDGAEGDAAAGGGVPGGRPFLRGLVVDLANPKAAVFFTSLFASLVPADLSLRHGVAILAVVATVVYAWYLALAALVSLPAPQRLYRRASRAVNRVAAVVVGTLGVRLALSG